MRRWTIRIVIILAVLLIVAGVGLFVVLRTALPGEWILRATSRKLGVEVTAESFSVRWTGRTIIRDLTVKTPLNAEPVLSVDAVELSHSAVPFVLLRRQIGLRAVALEKPIVRLEQDRTGRWNLQEIAARWAARKRTEPAPVRTRLPRLDIDGGAFQLADPNDGQQTIGPIDVHGRAEDRSVWTFHVEAESGAELKGQVVENGDWKHSVGFDLSGLGAVLRPLAGEGFSSLAGTGRWEGRLVDGVLTGRLSVDEMALAGARLHGAVAARLESGAVTLQPDGLVVSEPNVGGHPVRFSDGAVRITAADLRLDHLGAEVGSTATRLDGSWSWNARKGQFSGSWAGTWAGGDAVYHGTCAASVVSPRLGRKETQLRITAEAETPLGDWDAVVETQGAGIDWRKSHWQVSAPKLVWSRGDQRADASDMVAEIDLGWPHVRLVALRIPHAKRTQAAADYHAETRHWSVRLNATGLAPEGMTESSVDLLLHGEGDAEKAIISEFRLTQGERFFTGRGQIPLSGGALQDVHVAAEWPSRLPDPNLVKEASITGRWRCQADIAGKTAPFELAVTGALSGRNVILGKRRAPQVEIPIRADVTGAAVDVASEPFSLLGGRWRISGRHGMSDRLTQLALTVENLSLQAAAQMAGSPIKCRGQAQAQLQLAVPNFAMRKAVASGNWSAEDVTIPPFEANRASGKLRISDGLVRFGDIQLEQGQGRAHGSMQFRLNRPQCLSIHMQADGWPVESRTYPLQLRIDSQADLVADVVARTIDGQGRLAGRVLWEDQELGHASLSGSVQGRTLDVQELRAEVLGGSVDGVAKIPLDQWTQSTAHVRWQGIQPGLLAAWRPEWARFEGAVYGSLAAHSAVGDVRALEPLRWELHAETSDGRFGSARIGAWDMAGYLGRTRFLVDQSTLHALDGRVDLRARVSKHAGDFYTLVVADFNDFSVDQVARLFDPNGAGVEGRLAGDATVLLSSNRLALGGQAHLRLSQSDLANNAVVRTLYDTLNRQRGEKKPTGTGEMTMHLEGHTLNIPSFVYFNRGVETRGSVQIEDVTAGAQSPVQGYAVGSTRVLKGVALPGVKELDRLMASFQTGVASVQIKGTVGTPEAAVVPLPVISDSFRRLLWSQLRE